MAREVSIYFGGKDRLLWFDARDGIEIKKQLGKKPKRVLDEDIMVQDDDGIVHSADIDLNSLAVLLYCGIRHTDRKDPQKFDKSITTDVVIDWLSEYAETAPILTLAKQIEDALYLSGILGYPVDIKALAEQKAKREAEGAEPVPEDVSPGKAEIPSTGSPTT